MKKPSATFALSAAAAIAGGWIVLSAPVRAADAPKSDAPKTEAKKDAPKTDAPKSDPKAAKKAPAPKPESFLDAAKAGPDFADQGEYVGTVGEHKLGVQVVALGDGKFDVYVLRGGLPGEGWTGKTEDRIKLVGERAADGSVTVKIGEGKDDAGKLAGGKFTGKSGKGDAVSAERVVRKSPTLGAKAPEGAVVLLDGTEATAKARFNKAKFDEEGNLLTQGTGGYLSKDKFGDFSIHVEFRTPFTPKGRGQGRGNSGVYCQGRYETQVLDSFGLTGEHNECGGIYENYKPAVNMCFPPLSWQTYDIEYTAARFDASGKKTANARMTVVHNGVKIHDNIELTKGATRAAPFKEAPEAGPLHLQDHGDPVTFRNIWIVEKKN